MTKLLAGALLTVAAFAQPKAQPDLCVPPPSGTAPALPAHLMTGQGTEYVHFAITTSNPEAQKFFDQGLAQLHSFWAVEAERSFLQAARWIRKRRCRGGASRWWRRAITVRGINSKRRTVAAGTGVAGGTGQGRGWRRPSSWRRLRARRTTWRSCTSPRLPRGVYRTAKESDEGYIKGLRAITAKYPKEVEAQLFLSLHLMRGFELPDRTPRPDSMESVAILRQLLKDAPDHPGVHHYVIHAWEGSSFASDAWPSCKRYAELVTNIPHALHMPGHIYSQTGKFDLAEKYFGMANGE